MKYFSFLTGEELREVPEEKIIPSKEFSQLKKASEILKKIKTDAEEYRKQVVEECESLKERAFEEGYQDGLSELNAHILQLDKLLKNVREEINKKVLPIALKAAKKILGDELKMHPERIVDIVIQALKPVVQHHQIRIYVNKADMQILENQKKKIKKHLEQVESFSIQERPDVQPGGCIIETEAGIINAQLENQWRAMESAFEAFMKK